MGVFLYTGIAGKAIENILFVAKTPEGDITLAERLDSHTGV
jgi:hypothetical protein